MGRRTSGQTVGLQTIGNVQANASTLTTTQTNQDITIDPNGAGVININGNTNITGTLTMLNRSAIALRETSTNGTNAIIMQAAANMATDYTITWPSAVASTNGFVLSSDTSGNLSWANAGGNIAVTDPGPTATVHYPLFGTNAGGLPSTLSPFARTNLAFIPSTGELFSDIGRHPNIIGSTANSGTITIRGTSAVTKAAASVLLTDNVASSSTTTGTLVVTGGMGVSGQATINNISVTAGTASSTTGTGALIISGGVGVGGQLTCTTLVETSSIAFKENINPIENALDTILKLVGVTYDRKDNMEHEAGLIAEDVYKTAPDLVSLDKDGKPYGIKYTKLGAYLIESIKSLKLEIENLKK